MRAGGKLLEMLLDDVSSIVQADALAGIVRLRRPALSSATSPTWHRSGVATPTRIGPSSGSTTDALMRRVPRYRLVRDAAPCVNIATSAVVSRQSCRRALGLIGVRVVFLAVEEAFDEAADHHCHRELVARRPRLRSLEVAGWKPHRQRHEASRVRCLEL